MRRPRPLALLAVLLLLLAVLAPPVALAQDDDEEESEPTPVELYLMRIGRNWRAGLNGIITWPADVPAMSADGDEIFEDLPAASYTGPVFGAGGGLLQGLYRLMTGVGDLVFAPIPAMPMLSPRPRYKVIPYLHDFE